MSFEVDQSGKLEDTSVPSVLAFSNSKKNYIYLKSSAKRKLQKYFSDSKKIRGYIYKTFACLLYLLIRRYRLSGDIIVDVEYSGNMNLIKSHVFRIFKKYEFDSEKINISFKLIGKKSSAHEEAIRVFRKRTYKKENVVTTSEILKILEVI